MGGARRVCSEKMETECNTEMVQHRMEEDRPNCKVRWVDSCKPRKKKKAFFAFLERERKRGDPSSSEVEMRCEKVRAVRCRVEKEMVTKTQPETRCRRVPRQFCRKETCGGEEEEGEGEEGKERRGGGGGRRDDECYFRTQMVSASEKKTRVSDINGLVL